MSVVDGEVFNKRAAHALPRIKWPAGMIRISLTFIWNTATELEPLASLPERETSFVDVLFPLFTASGALNNLTASSIFAPYFRASYLMSQELHGLISAQINHPTFDRAVSTFDLLAIKNSYRQYRTALLAELGSLNSYFVTQKGAYDMYGLLSVGEMLFPGELVAKVPEAIVDAREAAKALCFDVPTACGFHTFRATESVLRRYWSEETKGAAPPKVRSIGVYLAAFHRAQRGDPKILAALKQMNELHRNPLVHPEVVLTSEEAIAIVGIARSVIAAMLEKLPSVPPTTSNVSLTLTP